MSNDLSVAISALGELLDRARLKVTQLESCQKTRPFGDLKSRELLYKELATATERLNSNQRTLSALIRTKAQARALRVKCKNEAYNSLRQVSILQIDEMERSCIELIEAARAMEKGFEAQCRFLHTTQWLVSSQYFND